MQLKERPQQWQVGLILSLGVLAISTAAIFIRLSIQAADRRSIGFSLFLAASRLIVSALILLPAWGSLRGVRVPVRAYGYAMGAGLCLALNFATWTTSLSFTSIAASTAIVTTNPVWVSLLSWLWFKEKPSRLTGIGIVVALAGGSLIALSDRAIAQTSSNPWLGDGLALVGAWMVSLYLLLGREAQRQGLSISHYIIIAYTTAAIALFPLPWLFGSGYSGYPQAVYVYVLLMAIFSQLIGHTSFNWAIRWLSPVLVTLAILFEPVGASFLGFVLFAEVPPAWVLLGGCILLLGVALAVAGQKNI
jgi:drug/metabolite transporter (DMT)-like permease